MLRQSTSNDAEERAALAASARVASLPERDPPVGKTEEAIRDGLQLQRWLREKEDELQFFPLRLKGAFRLPNKADAFFSELLVNGEKRTIKGCRQEIEFGRLADANAPRRLRDFVLGEFLKRAHWVNEDGSDGGFTIEKGLYRTVDGQVGKFSGRQRAGPMDWRELGQGYAWVVLRIHIHDFIVSVGPWRQRFREVAYFVPHPEFVRVVENPSPEVRLEVSVGYPCVDVAPFPNFFGFGPGKFGSAVKLFSFFLTTQGEVRVRMMFAAAPRARKVFDFGRNIPDPVYGGAELLRYLTLGVMNPQLIHDWMDAKMLALHCQVHQTLMDGLEKIWGEWIRSHS